MKDVLPPALATGLEKALSADDCPDWLRLVISMLMTFMDSLYQQARANTELLSKLVTENAELRAELDQLRKAPFKPKSERHASSPGEGKSKLAGAEKESGEPKEPRTGPPALDGAPLKEQIITHPVPPEALHCPLCGGRSFVAMPPEDAIEYELIVENLTRLIHRRQKMACTCGGHIVTAPCPERVTEGGRFGRFLHAWVITRRCMDGIPINRMGDILRQNGTPMATSTLNDLFHAGTETLRVLHTVLKNRVQLAPVVHADETPHRVFAPEKCETGFLWVFTSHDDVLMIHSENRSGETPAEILGDSTGFLIVDGYTGYNKVVETKGRRRQGCLVHARRKFVEALANHPVEARWMIGHIALLYAVESQIKRDKQQGTDTHRMVRDQFCRQITDNMRAWLDEQLLTVRPKSLLGKAVCYMHKQWPRLTLFLDHVELPMDNNPAERELRRPVIGRKTAMFARNHESAERYAIGYSLVMTCRKIGVDPIQYLAWVLPKVQGYNHKKLDDLLPHAFKRQELVA